jgi:hypothetical protein
LIGCVAVLREDWRFTPGVCRLGEHICPRRQPPATRRPTQGWRWTGRRRLIGIDLPPEVAPGGRSKCKRAFQARLSTAAFEGNLVQLGAVSESDAFSACSSVLPRRRRRSVALRSQGRDPVRAGRLPPRPVQQPRPRQDLSRAVGREVLPVPVSAGPSPGERSVVAWTRTRRGEGTHMSPGTPGDVSALTTPDEVQVSTRRRDGSLRRPTTVMLRL